MLAMTRIEMRGGSPISKVLSARQAIRSPSKVTFFMEIHYYIGVDVSKATLDWAVFDGKTIVLQTQSANSPTGIKSVVKLLKALPDFAPQTSVCCLEHTGVYNAPVLEHLHRLDYPLWLESSLHIKHAGGLQRGKTDAIDAVRIAEYAFRFRDRVRPWQPPREVLQALALLSSLRRRLLGIRQQLKVPANELNGFVGAKLHKQVAAHCQASLKAIEADISRVNRQIHALIEADERLKELFGLVTSVPGVGETTAVEVILATNEFQTITEPKKLACHAGVAPFEHRSGTSVRGKTRVNQHARKRLKSLFHLGAMATIRAKGELQTYYERKVAEGKNKMLVLNAVRNKLIHRIYAVVKRKQKYDFSFSPSLA